MGQPTSRTHHLPRATGANDRASRFTGTGVGVCLHRLATSVAAGALLIFNLRRLALLLAAAYDLWMARRQPPGERLLSQEETPRDALILVPLRNEAACLPDLMGALLALDYPPGHLTIGLIDDGSSDGSSGGMDSYARAHWHVQVLHLPASQGKANALNAGLLHWPQGQVVVVYDADARPTASSLAHLVAAFADPAVAAASGLIRPANGLATLVATYSAVERLVHQQVTVRAKDRLGLAPAILGSNCAYRRDRLVEAGGFPKGALLEDSHLTLALARRGHRLRFLPHAVALDQVPETLRGYWRQHVRWGRGFYDAAEAQLRPRSPGGKARAKETGRDPTQGNISPLQRVELWLFGAGYLDRLALGLGTLSLLWPTRTPSRLRGWLRAMMSLNVMLPYLQIGLALAAEGASAAWWIRLPLLPLFFAVDLAAAVWSAALSLARRPQTWQPTERTRV